jgi:hypothetical protein
MYKIQDRLRDELDVLLACGFELDELVMLEGKPKAGVRSCQIVPKMVIGAYQIKGAAPWIEDPEVDMFRFWELTDGTEVRDSE